MAAAANPMDLTQVPANTPSMNASRQRSRYLSAEEYSVFQELSAEYLTLDHSVDHPNAHSLADAIIHKDIDEQCLTRNDIDALETALIRLEPLHRVRERVCALSQQYSQLVGGPQKSLNFEQLDEATIRARAEQLLADLHTARSIVRGNQKLCSKLLATFLLSTLFVITGLVILGLVCTVLAGLWPEKDGQNGLLTFWAQIAWGLDTLPPMFSMLIAGAIGALISGLLRLQKITAEPGFALQSFGNPSLLNAAISPVIGAFAAWFIFSCFAGKLIEGNILPDFTWQRDSYPLFGGILQAVPLDPASNAKMLLVGLVSGFSERLFPDLLNKVSKAIEPSQKVAPSE
jgi:hypothetical protein